MEYDCRNKFKFIYDFDLFAKAPEIYYKGKPKRVSWIGRISTVSYLVLYAIILMYKFIKMIKKEEISFYETYAFSGIPSINISNENFYGGFALGSTPFIDETIYYPVVTYIKRQIKNGQEEILINKIVDVGRCELNDFDPRYRELFKDKPLDNLYCMKNYKETLDGYTHSEIYSYFNLRFYKCQNQTKDGEKCKSSTVIDSLLTANVFKFFIQDIELTPQNYNSPIQISQKIITGPAFKNLFQQIFTYMQLVILETDADFIGLNAFSKYKTQKFLKYDESWIISSPSFYNYDQGYPLCEITIQLSEKVLTQRRTFPKLIEILGDVGGTMEVLFSVFGILVSFLSRDLYLSSLTNNLFSFNIDKKIIYLKENKNHKLDDISIEKDLIINENNKDDKNLEKNLIIKKINLAQNFPSQDLILGRTLKFSKRNNQRAKTSMNVNFSKSERNKINSFSSNLQNDELTNNKVTIGELEHNKEESQKNEQKETIKRTQTKIINKIEINKVYYLICFIYSRKRINIENILLEESLRIISEKLDILNIFKRLYRDENINKNNIMEMSKECKLKLYEYRNKVLKNS